MIVFRPSPRSTGFAFKETIIARTPYNKIVDSFQENEVERRSVK